MTYNHQNTRFQKDHYLINSKNWNFYFFIYILLLAMLFPSCVQEHSHEQEFQLIDYYQKSGQLDSALVLIYTIKYCKKDCIDAMHKADAEFNEVYEISAKKIYENAIFQYNKGDFDFAKILLRDIIDSFSSTIYIHPAKELYHLIESQSGPEL